MCRPHTGCPAVQLALFSSIKETLRPVHRTQYKLSSKLLDDKNIEMKENKDLRNAEIALEVNIKFLCI